MSALKQLIKRKCPTKLKKPALKIVHKSRMMRNKIEMVILPKRMKWFCPCCGMKIKSFIEADYIDAIHYNPERYAHTRQDVLCPVCKALPRHRILASWCDTHRGLFNSKDILYFAPEYCMSLWMKRSKVKYKTADLYAEADYKLDIQATGLPESSFDLIICNHVLEHVDDFRVALREINRILRKGGSFICSFPMDPKIEYVDEDPNSTVEERIKRFGQHDHKRVFGMKSDEFLVENGFVVEKICGEDYPNDILPVVGPADYDMNILFRCIKTQ